MLHCKWIGGGEPMRVLAHAVAVALVLFAPAVAYAAPPGVVAKNGVWQVSDDARLFTHVRDVEPGKSACDDACFTVWAPLVAADDAVEADGWTVATQEDGRRLWALHGKPVYRLINPERNGYEASSALWLLALSERWLPEGVKLLPTDLFAKSDGGALKTHAPDTCGQECKAMWRPFAAPADAVGNDEWSIVETQGVRAWAYGPRKYILYEELPNPTPEARRKWGSGYFSDMSWISAIHWPQPLSPVAIQAGAVDVHDATVTKVPKLSPDSVMPDYPPASLRYREEGFVSVQFCVGADGVVSRRKLAAGSGYDRLDDATYIWAKKVLFVPGEVNGQPAETCGYMLEFQWIIQR